ncbi:fucose isomerase [Paenibacillus filicis]|uniref:Fucose isomerase n=1 Tax=Paenibacillus gyeongsangnamensis TaxID=3388067 RepID=A0ABT4QDA2_9BACL|nr:RbsD/FucU domain-containing protein [Paenibacillus filicis]MCZ8514762.1 fucose isomerase [Paenibacillus filicis]
MLKGIPPIISPDLIKILMEMGHGDEIVLADGNFPAAANTQRLLRYDGHTIPALLQAIMPLFPLDHAVERSAAVMSLLPGDAAPPVWERYREAIEREKPDFTDFDYVERFAFYERAKKAYAIVATSDSSYKGNLILKKGVVRSGI